MEIFSFFNIIHKARKTNNATNTTECFDVERYTLGEKKSHTPVLVIRRVEREELAKESQKAVKIIHTRHVLTIFIHISFIFRTDLFFGTCHVM